MCGDWESDWKTDRYSVVITNPSTTQPKVLISRLKKGTARGDMKHIGQVKDPLSKAGMTKEWLANAIGMRIIEDSPIMQKWFEKQVEK